MYSKNYDKPDGITVPPEYGGTSVGASFSSVPESSPCPPVFPPPPPKRSLLDLIPSDDLILFGAAILILSRGENDLLSLGLLIMLVLL